MTAQHTESPESINPQLLALVEARHHAPYSLLGRRSDGAQERIVVFLPDAKHVRLGQNGPHMARVGQSAIFEWRGAAEAVPTHYRVCWTASDGTQHEYLDPYSFPPSLPEFDLHLFGEGRHWNIYRILGAHVVRIDGIAGVRFAVWAPNAERVSVVGEFNRWDGRRHPMQVRGSTGVWELFIPELNAGALYKFEIRNQSSGEILLKSDPYGQQFELRPDNASIVTTGAAYKWTDEHWMEARKDADWLHAPMSVYEVHIGSWQRQEAGEFPDYRDIAQRLVSYVCSLGFTHIELLPVTEHPLDESWGYQSTGYYAPTSRFGPPEDFAFFVDYCHQHGIGVLLDWVPAHFPKDSHGLARYDGSALYEHEDPRRAEHRDWGTLIYNYGRSEVRNFLIASAVYWLEEFHIDGLRVDAVASMLYLDYSRDEDDWTPNIHGGNENLEAMAFLRELNTVTHERYPGTLTIAEESTSWPQVSRPTWLGGLGFSMKWNMGWMHDTLEYISKDPVHRHYHHDRLTFGMLYAFTENFVLAFSHDEMVHGKSSLLNKMPGDEWQRFANLRLLYTYMYSYPGKKLLFMGAEFGQGNEWNLQRSLDWHVLDYPLHQGVQSLITALNQLYRSENAIHHYDFETRGFEWIDCHDSDQSVLSYQRKSDGEFVVVVLNFTPVPRYEYKLGVPAAGRYQEILNSDSALFGGSDIGNSGGVEAQPTPWMGHPYSINLVLPPLAGLVFKLAAC